MTRPPLAAAMMASDPARFLAASRLLIVTGKGGVGKTTVTAALALAAARSGLSSLVVEVEGKGGLAALFGAAPLVYRDGDLVDGVRGRTLTADRALVEYLGDHGMARVAKRLVRSGVLDIVATAAPGIKDILLLGKVKQLERSDPADVVILDTPAAGHAVTFLASPLGLLDAVRVGPIGTQARDVLDMLRDPARCRVVLVTVPEETPVREAVETAFQLEQRVGVSLGLVVVNGVYPSVDGLDLDPTATAAEAGIGLRPGDGEALTAAARFRRRRMALQAEHLGRLAVELPLSQVRLPFRFGAGLGPADLEVLARELRAQLTAPDVPSRR